MGWFPSPAVAVAAGLLIGIPLAGCVGSNGSGSSEAGERLAPEDGGAIVGVVVDDSLQPIPDASVVLDGQVVATTDSAGAFEFPVVAAGEHSIAASKEGYASSVVRVTVVVDESARVTLALIRNAIADAYHETIIESGLIACAIGYRAPGADPNQSMLNPCAVFFILGIGGLDEIAIDWKIGPLGDDKVGFWAETRWTPAFAFQRGMVVRWVVENRPIFGSGYGDRESREFAHIKGNSPLSIRIPISWLDQPGFLAGGVPTGRPVCAAGKDCYLLSGHYAHPQTTNSTVLDIGIFIQQRYEEFLTIFHKGVLPEQFTALRDQ